MLCHRNLSQFSVVPGPAVAGTRNPGYLRRSWIPGSVLCTAPGMTDFITNFIVCLPASNPAPPRPKPIEYLQHRDRLKQAVAPRAVGDRQHARLDQSRGGGVHARERAADGV